MIEGRPGEASTLNRFQVQFAFSGGERVPMRAMGVWSLLFAIALSAETTAPEVAIRTHAYTPPSAILQAETNLVESEVTVRDADGHAVAGLTASDFEIFDNGVPQKIAAFSEVRSEAKASSGETSPRVSTFFFDDLHVGLPGPQGGFALPFVKQAARQFAEKYLRPGDRISIATASGAGGADFTDNAKQFIDAADRLNLHSPMMQSLAEYEAQSLATLYALGDAVKRLSARPGERTLVWVSAGFVIHIQLPHDIAHDVQHDVDSLIDAAVHSNVVINAIDAKGASVLPTAKINRPLKEISQGTGGHLFMNTNDLVGAMEHAVHPEVTYSIAFHPAARDGKFHTLNVKFTQKRRDEAIEFRPGYLSRKDEDAEKRLAARSRMDEAVFSKETLNELPASVTLTGGQPKNGEIPVSVHVAVDVNRLQFAAAHGRHAQQLVFLVTLLNSNGEFISGKESIMDLTLTDSKLASMKQSGLTTIATLDAPPGVYQVRTIVREAMKGALAATTTPVELRAK